MMIRKNDEVLVIAGENRGKKGKVRHAYPRKDRVLVEGVNLIKRHMKPRGGARQAGIIEREAPISASDVMLICTKCHRPARVGHLFLQDGSRVRICRKCHEVID